MPRTAAALVLVLAIVAVGSQAQVLFDVPADYFLYNTAQDVQQLGHSVSMGSGSAAYGQKGYGYVASSPPDIANGAVTWGKLGFTPTLVGAFVKVATHDGFVAFASAEESWVFGLSADRRTWSSAAQVPMPVTAGDSVVVEAVAMHNGTMALALRLNSGLAHASAVVALYDRVAVAVCAHYPAGSCSEATDTSGGFRWARSTVLTRVADLTYGAGLAVYQSYAAIGVPGDNRVDIHKRTVDANGVASWPFQHSVRITNSTENVTVTGNEQFGQSVSISDRFMVVGGPGAGPYEAARMGSRDVGLGTENGGALWVLPSPVLQLPEPARSARVCRVASIFTNGKLGFSHAQATNFSTTLIMGGTPGASRVLVVRVDRDGNCSKYDRIKGFAYSDSGARDMGYSVAFDNQLAFFGSPLADNSQQGPDAKIGRLYVKAYCFPNHYMEIRSGASSGPAVRQCTPCNAGYFSHGGSSTFFTGGQPCELCSSAGVPINSEWVRGAGCAWRCKQGYFGNACELCSVYQEGRGKVLPAHAHWVDGHSSCFWQCDVGFVQRPDHCEPPPVPDTIADVVLHSPGASAATATFFQPFSAHNAALLAFRFHLLLEATEASEAAVVAFGTVRVLPFATAIPASPADVAVFEAETGIGAGNGTLVSVVVPDMLAKSTYRVNVSASNVGGWSLPSNFSDPVTTSDATVSSAVAPPAGGAATSSKLNWTWSRPPDLGGQPVVQYRLCSARVGVLNVLDGAAHGCAVISTAADSPITATGLNASTAYAATVQARNDVGWGPFSAASEPVVTMPATPPTNPGPAQCASATGSTVSLVWAAPEDLGGELVSYTVLVLATNASLGDLPVEVGHTRAPHEHSTTVTHLQAESAYLFAVSAHNSAGGSQLINASMWCVTGPPTIASAPGVPVVASVTSDSATVTWHLPRDLGGTPTIAYYVRATAIAGTFVGSEHHWRVPPTPTFEATGLWHTTVYVVSVLAENSVGNSSWSDASDSFATGPATPASAPSKPAFVAATGGTLTVSWSKPTDIGGAPVTSYIVQVTSSLCCVPFWVSTEVAGTTAVLPRLVAQVGYHARVQAVTVAGAGAFSAASSTLHTASATVAGQVVDLTAHALGPSVVQVAWATPEDYGGALVSKYAVSVSAGGLSFTTAAVLASTDKTERGAKHAYAYNVTGLLGSTEYRLRVVAINSQGTGAASDSAPVTTPAPVAPISPPTPTVNKVGSSTVQLEWAPPLDAGGANVTSYTVVAHAVVARPGSELPADTLHVFATSLRRTFEIRGLEGSTSYKFRIAAANIVGLGDNSGWSAVVTTLEPVPPSPPSTPAATSVGSSSVELAWDPPLDWGGDNAGAQYVVHYAEAAAFGSRYSTVVDASVAGATITGLTASTQYVFSVGARTNVGSSRSSDTSGTVTTLAATAPAAPSAPTVSIGASTAEVHWAAPGDTGGSPVLGYVVTVSGPPVAGGAAVSTNYSTGAVVTTTVPNLAAQASYSFAVAARTAAGTGPFSQATSVTSSAATAASAPRSVAIATASTTSVVVTWLPPSDLGGSPVTEYVVTVAVSGGSVVSTVTSAASPATVTGLDADTAYVARVAATTSAGVGALSSDSDARTTSGVVPPGCPSVSVGSITAGTASVTWTPSGSSGGSARTGYEYTLQATLSWGVQALVTTVDDAAATDVTLSGLVADTGYSLLLRAVNSAGGSVDCASTSFTTASVTVPGAPTGVAGANPESDSVEVAWAAPLDDGGASLSHYLVECAADGAWATSPCAVVTAPTTTVTVTQLSAATAYTFRVTAVNSEGASPVSTASSAVSTAGLRSPSAPTSPRPVSGGATWVMFAWGLPTSNGGAPVASFALELFREVSVGAYSVAASATVSAGLVHTFGNLTASSFYFFKVAATNAGLLTGPAAQSGLVKTGPPIPPAAPTRVRVLNATANRVELAWVGPVDNGGDPVSAFVLYTTRVGNAGEQTLVGRTEVAVPANTPTATAFTHEVRDLDALTSYWFHVAAVNVAGEGANSEASGLTTTLPPVPPSKPGQAVLSDVTASTLRVAWTLPDDLGGVPLTGFTVFVEADGPDTCIERDCSVVTVTVADVAVAGASTAAYTLDDLVADTSYRVRVAAHNSAGQSFPGMWSASAVTPGAVPSSAPLNVRAVSVTASTLVVEWEPPSDFGGAPVVQYTIYTGEDAASLGPDAVGNVVSSVQPTEREYRVRHLFGDTEYFVRMAAVTSAGEGVLSATSSSVHTAPVVNPSPPRNFTVATLNRTFVELSWMPTADAGGQPVQCYEVQQLVDGDLRDACSITGYSPGSGAVLYTNSLSPDAFNSLPFQFNATEDITPPATTPAFTSVACVSSSPTRIVVQGSLVARFRLVAVTYPRAGQAGTLRRSNSTSMALVLVPAGEPPKPDAPAALVVKGTSVSVGYSAPDFDGGCPLLHMDLYLWARGPPWLPGGGGGTGPWDRSLLMHAVRDFSILTGEYPLRWLSDNLTRATEYIYTTSATNALGSSLPSPGLRVTTHTVPASPPLGVTVNESFWVTASVHWGPPYDNGGAAVEDYIISVAFRGASGAVPDADAPGAWNSTRTGSTDTFGVAQYLLPANRYFVRVAAVTAHGDGQPSVAVPFDTRPPLPCPNNCSGHGRCHLWDGSCACDTGYVPTNCSTIDGADGVLFTTGLVEPEEYPAFKKRFSERMGLVLSVPPSRVHVLGLTPVDSASRRLLVLEDLEADYGSRAADELLQPTTAVTRRWRAVQQSSGASAQASLVRVELVDAHDQAAAGTDDTSSVWARVVEPASRARATLAENHFMRVWFVVLNSVTAGDPPAKTVLATFVARAQANDADVAGVGISAVQVASGVQAVRAPSCNATRCEGCLEQRGCGFCQTRGVCEVGSRLGPAFGADPCQGNWFYADALASNNTCLPHCSTLSGCDSCMSRPDCTYCESRGECAARMPEAAKGSCPAFKGVGWMADSQACPSHRCTSYNTCDQCVLDSGCGYCTGATSKCFGGDSFGPNGPAQTCPASSWRYSSCTLLCTTESSCQACFGAASRFSCGWCPSKARCGAGNTQTQGINSTAPKSGSCPDWIGNVRVCPPRIPTDAERCLAATNCGTCLSTETVGATKCAWCGKLPTNKCQLATAASIDQCLSVGDKPLNEYCVQKCSDQQYVYSRNGTISVGSAGLHGDAVPYQYEANEVCDWIITPVEVVAVGSGGSGSTSTMRFPLVLADVVALDLGDGDSLSIYDGRPAQGTLLAKFTSIDNTLTGHLGIESDTGYMHLRFQSDSLRQGTGFKVMYTSGRPSVFDIYFISAVVITAVCFCLCCLCCCNRFFTRRQMFEDGDEEEDETLQASLEHAQRTGRGATTDIISQFPAFKFFADKVHLTPLAKFQELSCCICLTEYEDADEIRCLPCKHSFHVDCVDQWLQLNSVCPLCKRDVNVMLGEYLSQKQEGAPDTLAIPSELLVVAPQGADGAHPTGAGAGSNGNGIDRVQTFRAGTSDSPWEDSDDDADSDDDPRPPRRTHARGMSPRPPQRAPRASTGAGAGAGAGAAASAGGRGMDASPSQVITSVHDSKPAGGASGRRGQLAPMSPPGALVPPPPRPPDVDAPSAARRASHRPTPTAAVRRRRSRQQGQADEEDTGAGAGPDAADGEARPRRVSPAWRTPRDGSARSRGSSRRGRSILDRTSTRRGRTRARGGSSASSTRSGQTSARRRQAPPSSGRDAGEQASGRSPRSPRRVARGTAATTNGGSRRASNTTPASAEAATRFFE